MSLGFLTESALLPSKSKAIKVDSRSQIPLKALVAEGLSKRETGGADTLRKVRGKKRAIDDRRRDVFSEKNKGVDERHKKDMDAKKAESVEERERLIPINLQRKAQEYDRIMRGEEDIDDDEDNLVDFAKKRRMEGGAEAAGGPPSGPAFPPPPTSASSNGGPPLREDEVEVVDEFGRCRRVHKDSEEGRAVRAAQAALRRHEALFGKKGGQRGAGSHQSSAAAPEPRNARGVLEEREEAQGQWAWSRGDELQQQQQQSKKEAAAAPEAHEKEAPKTTTDGAILTQWERRLQSQAQAYLQQVITEEQQQGADDGKTILAEKLKQRDEKRLKLLQRLKQKTAGDSAT